MSHLGKKDFGCPKCGIRYGYKHLLQRHFARQHKQTSGSASDDSESEEEEARSEKEKMDIDTMTGSAYVKRARRKVLRCPYPDLEQIAVSRDRCEYVFTRAYDLRRHLRAVHGMETE